MFSCVYLIDLCCHRKIKNKRDFSSCETAICYYPCCLTQIVELIDMESWLLSRFCVTSFASKSLVNMFKIRFISTNDNVNCFCESILSTPIHLSLFFFKSRFNKFTIKHLNCLQFALCMSSRNEFFKGTSEQ